MATVASGEEAFTLQKTQTGQISGPYMLRDGARIQLNDRAYQMRIVPPDRLSFISIATGRVFGPVQTIEGRLVEIDQAMFTFSWKTERSLSSVQPAPARRPPLPPPPRAPPRPEPIPIPDIRQAEPPKPRTPLPELSRDWRVSAWYAPVHDTPMNWKVDGRRANDMDLSRETFGGAMLWHGWAFQLELSPSVSSGELLPAGMDVTRSELDDGTGWSLAAGYRRPLLVRGGWEASGGARVSISRDDLKLTSNTAVGQRGTNDMIDVSYVTRSTDITVTELALWLDLGLTYSAENWGLYLDLGFQPIGTVEVDGGLVYNGRELAIKADRDQPMMFTGGAWVGVSPWRFFADYTVGSDETLRLGVSFDF
jgi:hypothetical protein